MDIYRHLDAVSKSILASTTDGHFQPVAHGHDQSRPALHLMPWHYLEPEELQQNGCRHLHLKVGGVLAQASKRASLQTYAVFSPQDLQTSAAAVCEHKF